ncbi:hypothetical protein TWF191_004842 [Orbilia oligospora]|uniref:Rhodopsin domain-containing protein n=1 Tax=Orbilia oligospora TaxID=2813651 RepID=A0A7C8UWM2_ORBOL|nr:hypothetical protein TWF679_010666 [Orbilia oligospora]KAF3226180.1 hypothetical protein TWF191_004842 [Orbilia oligospora]
MENTAGWYERYNVEKPNPHNSFIFVPDYITNTWPAPNYDNPESRVTISRVVEPLTLGLACVAVGLRLCSRLIGSKKLFREDYWIIAAVFFCALKSAIVIASTTVGFGLHRYDIHPNDVRTLNKYYLMGILFYLACVMFTKASIILRYKRMFPPEVTHIRRTSQILVAGFFALFVVTATLMVNTCGQLYCRLCDLSTTDPLSMETQPAQATKIEFGRVSIKLHDEGFFDWTWKGPVLWSCTAFELLFAITAASLPDLKALVAKFLPRLISHGSSDDHNFEAGISPRDGAQNLAIVNPAALSPNLLEGNRGSKRLSRPYWLRSQLEGSLFNNSIPSRRGSAVPSAEGDMGGTKQANDVEKAEKRVTMIFEEDTTAGSQSTVLGSEVEPSGSKSGRSEIEPVDSNKAG